MDKRLGKIKSVRFGYAGYQEAMMGLRLEIGGDCWGVGADITGGWCNHIEITKHTKWTEESRNKERAELVEKIDTLLSEAKVDDVYKLEGVPVEVDFDRGMLRDWRILTEVI